MRRCRSEGGTSESTAGEGPHGSFSSRVWRAAISSPSLAAPVQGLRGGECEGVRGADMV